MRARSGLTDALCDGGARRDERRTNIQFETECRVHGTPAIRSSNLFHITVNKN